MSKDAIDEAWQEVLRQVNEEFDNVIEEVGAFPQFPDQDIVDTGNLRDSKITIIEGNRLTSAWDAVDPRTGYQYPSLIKNGGFFGRRYLAGRDWTEEALRRVNPPRAIAALLNKMGGKVKVKFSRFD